MQVSYNLNQGLGAIDNDAPGSYNSSLYPFVTANEAKQLERLVASQYGEININNISANEDRTMGAGMTMQGKYRKGTAAIARGKLDLRLYDLNAQKQKMAVDAATVKAQTQLAETAKASAAKAQADTLTALQNAGLVKKSTSTSEAQKIIDSFNQTPNNQNTTQQNTTPAEKTGMSTQTKLMIGGALLTLAAITTIAVVKNRNNKANKQRNGY